MTKTPGLQPLSKRTLRLLAIEEDLEHRQLIAKSLQKVPGGRYVVEWATTLAAFKEQLETEGFDAAVVVPRLEPAELGKLVSDLRALCQETAIILLAGEESAAGEQAGCEMAVDFLMSKSDLSPKGIDRAIRYAIRNRDQQLRLMNFSRLVAHDLMGPVGNVRSAAETLGMVLPDFGEDSKELMEVLRADCDNLMEILSALHEFSDCQHRTLKPEKLPLGHILERALGALNLGAALEDGRVVCGALPDASVDPDLFVQVFQKLIQNGLMYNASARPSVTIESIAGPGRCELRFLDNGIGIEPAKAAEVFRPLYRLHGASEYEGVGLGLAVCKEIVERHGGEIWLEPGGGEGQGCAFCLRLGAS